MIFQKYMINDDIFLIEKSLKSSYFEHHIFIRTSFFLRLYSFSNGLRVIVKPQYGSRFNPFCEKTYMSNKLFFQAIPSKGCVFQDERMNQDKRCMTDEKYRTSLILLPKLLVMEQDLFAILFFLQLLPFLLIA